MKFFTTFCFIIAFAEGFSQTSWRKLHEELVLTSPPFQECHASTVVEVAPGKLLLAFFAGKHEGNKDVTIWIITKEEDKWGRPVSIVDGKQHDALRYPCWNPVLFKLANGDTRLYYKVGPNPANWWGMESTSFDNGLTWSPGKRLAGDVLGPIKNKPVQLADGRILSPSSSEKNGRWKVFIESSTDAGKTWRILPVDTGSAYKVIQPAILIHPGRRLQILCRSDQDSIVQSWSEDNGATWGPFSKLPLQNPNSGIDAVTLQNGKHLLVYNPGIKGREWFNNRGRLHVATSPDGVQWNDIMELENSETDEFSYPAVIQSKDGKVHITYTYKRKNIKHVVLAENNN